MDFPYNISDVVAEEDQQLIKSCFQGAFTRWVRVGPKGYCFPKPFQRHAPLIYNISLRPTDIFVASYQRSGTTWTQELVWLLLKDLDYEAAKSVTLFQRYTFLDMPTFYDEEVVNDIVKTACANESISKMLKMMAKPATDLLETLPDPRFVKTHFPLSFLPPSLLDNAKVVYIARDPRDVIVSSYHHTQLFTALGFIGDFKQYWNLFRKNLFTATPYFEHVKEYWSKRNHPNLLFLFYEDLLKDLKGSIHRVAKFLGKELTNDQLEGLCDHLSIENFKNNKSVNFEEFRDFGFLKEGEYFIRKGKSGGWREYFVGEMADQVNDWIKENLRDTDLRYPSMTDIEI